MVASPSKPSGSPIKPRSCVGWWMLPWGVSVWTAGFFVFGHYRNIAGLGEAASCLLVLLACGFLTGLGEWVRQGLPRPQRMPDGARLAFKLVGLAFTLGALSFVYWLFPVYHQPYYKPYFGALQGIAGLGTLLVVLAYIVYTDMCMDDPHDAYWHLGRAVILNWGSADRAILRTHLLGWMVKGFFLPLMFVQSLRGMNGLWTLLFQTASPTEYTQFHKLIFELMMTAEVCVAAVGYIFALQLFRSHIRSVEPSLLGWAVAVSCYAPFFDGVFKPYLDYHDALVWDSWLAPWPEMRVVWGCAILVLTTVYAASTFAFGIRFSNLTHRGIVTNGTYAWTKHPAYLSKNAFWWLVSVPFVAGGDPELALRHSLLLLGVNIVYALRAYTEERHLSRDDDYVRYALWMDRHSLFSFVGRLIPALSYARLHKAAAARVTSGGTDPG